MSGISNIIPSGPGFEDELIRILRNRGKMSLPEKGVVVAAVLVPLYLDNGRIHVLLTQRSELVEHHKGEISFPGGKLDAGDPDLVSCALRETQEEIGVSPGDVQILGELDDFYTVATGFLVVPFVGTIPYPYNFRTSPREINRLLGVPLEVFFDESRCSEYMWTANGKQFPVTAYLWCGHTIWGATARILKHFAEVITEGRGL